MSRMSTPQHHEPPGAEPFLARFQGIAELRPSADEEKHGHEGDEQDELHRDQRTPGDTFELVLKGSR